LPVVAGSGVRSDNLAAIFEYADAAIIGCSCRHLRSIGVTKPMESVASPCQHPPTG
jgi:predicted TIM-barrel enzyme